MSTGRVLTFPKYPGLLYCPRRNESPHGATHKLDEGDAWRERDGRVTCSWCGSMHPDHVFAAIRDGLQLEPTDKNYKLYLPGGKFYFQHFSHEEQLKFINHLNAGEIKLAEPGRFYSLPYFIGRKIG